ncbi:hypothetical protein BGZ94_004660 [Podila epigama]|nr:hypothetical protein BGZ94_004660 [Podila epigama]
MSSLPVTTTPGPITSLTPVETTAAPSSPTQPPPPERITLQQECMDNNDNNEDPESPTLDKSTATFNCNDDDDCNTTEQETKKLEDAAIRIQSAYRGYHARRELYGPALTASQKWRYLIDFTRIEYIHKMNATAPFNSTPSLSHSSSSSASSPSSSPSLSPSTSFDEQKHPATASSRDIIEATPDTTTATMTTTSAAIFNNAEAPNQYHNQAPLSTPPAYSREDRARWAWRRVEFLGSRLGKVRF